MMKQSISDDAVSSVLKQTASVIHEWDEKSPPTAAMQQAFIKDIQTEQDPQAIGNMIRKLNSEQAGFRTLLTKTSTKINGTPTVTDLVSIDARWSDPKYWLAINKLLSPVTDRYLLAAVDMNRDLQGNVQKMPASQSANLDIMLRTFWIAAMVTIICVLIGYPYAV